MNSYNQKGSIGLASNKNGSSTGKVEVKVNITRDFTILIREEYFCILRIWLKMECLAMTYRRIKTLGSVARIINAVSHHVDSQVSSTRSWIVGYGQ